MVSTPSLPTAGALFVNVTVEEIAEMLGNLVSELNAHTDVGHAAEQRFDIDLV